MKYKYLSLVLVVVLVVVGITLVKERRSNPAQNIYKNNFTVLAIEPLTGIAAHYGEQSKKGTDLAVQLINQELLDSEIQVVHEDSMYTGKGGLDAYSKVKAAKRPSAVLSFASPVSIALRPVLEADSVLQVAVSSSAKSFASPTDLSVRVSAVTDGEALPAVAYIKRKGYGRVALLQMQDEIGESMADSLRQELAKQSLSPVSSETYTVETVDFRSLLTKIFANSPDVVYVAGTGVHLANILLQSKELGLSAQFMSFRTAEDPVLLSMAGDLASGIVYTYAFDPTGTNPEAQRFVAAYQQKYDELPDGYAAEGYEGLRLAALALDTCGSSADRACLVDYFQHLRGYNSVLGTMSFDENGDVTYPFFLKTVRDGKFVRLEEGE